MTLAELVVAIAVVLSGEAGPMGQEGELLVARSIVSWTQEGETLEEALTHFYARGEPSLSALGIAYAVVQGGVEGDGLKYCVSRRDALRLGLVVEEWTCVDGWCLGRSREWVRHR